MGLGAGPRGYDDWQRTVNWDGPVIVAEPAGTQHTGSKVFGPFDVGRYGYVGGLWQVQSQAILVVLDWYADQAQAQHIGVRSYVMDAISGQANLRLPNLGPWLKISCVPLNGATVWQHSCQLLLTNRTHPLEFIPTNPTLLNFDAQVINANASATITPSSYYAGPLAVTAYTTSPPLILNLNSETSIGVFPAADSFDVEVGSKRQHQIMIAPPGTWQIVASNISAAQATVYVDAVPSLSGSS